MDDSIRVKKFKRDSGFSMLSDEIFDFGKLDTDSMFLYCYLNKQSPHYLIYKSKIMKLFKWGKARLNNAWNELLDCGYLQKTKPYYKEETIGGGKTKKWKATYWRFDADPNDVPHSLGYLHKESWVKQKFEAKNVFGPLETYFVGGSEIDPQY